jgi:hypothetical protein
MAITETEHFLGTVPAIQEINQSGGILGREIEVIAYDPGSDPETYRRMADRLLTEDGISVIFGCSTSAARKAILPAIERRNGLLWYPSLYEGFEYTPNVIYNVIYTGLLRTRTVFRSRNIWCATTASASSSSARTTSIHANPTGSCAISSYLTGVKSPANSMFRWRRRRQSCSPFSPA